MKKELEELVSDMRHAAKHCMDSWDAGHVIDAAKADDWADTLEEIIKDLPESILET
jgi:hypothetical protein